MGLRRIQFSFLVRCGDERLRVDLAGLGLLFMELDDRISLFEVPHLRPPPPHHAAEPSPASLTPSSIWRIPQMSLWLRLLSLRHHVGPTTYDNKLYELTVAKVSEPSRFITGANLQPVNIHVDH